MPFLRKIFLAAVVKEKYEHGVDGSRAGKNFSRKGAEPRRCRKEKTLRVLCVLVPIFRDDVFVFGTGSSGLGCFNLILQKSTF